MLSMRSYTVLIWVYFFIWVLRPIYDFGLKPFYGFVLKPIYGYILKPIFLMICSILEWISWVYRFRVTLMIQGLVCYWRGSIYFERSSLWETLLKEQHSEAKSYLVPLLWTVDKTFLIVVVVLVLVTAAFGENNMRRFFNIQGKIGINFYRVGKTVGEISLMRLVVYVGDKSADKSVAEIHIASFFACIYLTVASLLKLCYVGNNLGLVDGIASLALSTITHYCKSENKRIGMIFVCAFVIWIKNNIFTECCARCSQADQVVSDNDDASVGGRLGVRGLGVRGRGGGGGRGSGGGGRGSGGGGARRRHREGSGENMFLTGDVEEAIYSPRTSTQSAAF